MINDQLEWCHAEKVKYALPLEKVTSPFAKSVVFTARSSLIATTSEAENHYKAVVARHSERSNVKFAFCSLFPSAKPEVGMYLINRTLSAHNIRLSQATLTRNLSR